MRRGGLWHSCVRWMAEMSVTLLPTHRLHRLSPAPPWPCCLTWRDRCVYPGAALERGREKKKRGGGNTKIPFVLFFFTRSFFFFSRRILAFLFRVPVYTLVVHVVLLCCVLCFSYKRVNGARQRTPQPGASSTHLSRTAERCV